MAFLADPPAILTEFGRRMGILDIVFDDDGHCCLGVEDVVLNIEHNESLEQLIVLSEVGKLPAQPSAFLLSRYLAINHLALIMGAGGIGVDEDKRIVRFVERIPLRGLDIETLEADITHIVNRVEALKIILSSPGFDMPNMGAGDSAHLINDALSL